MCPAAHCKADNPVQVLMDPLLAEQIGHPELANAIRCTACQSVWRDEGGKRVIGRFSGPIVTRATWIPAR